MADQAAAANLAKVNTLTSELEGLRTVESKWAALSQELAKAKQQCMNSAMESAKAEQAVAAAVTAEKEASVRADACAVRSSQATERARGAMADLARAQVCVQEGMEVQASLRADLEATRAQVKLAEELQVQLKEQLVDSTAASNHWSQQCTGLQTELKTTKRQLEDEIASRTSVEQVRVRLEKQLEALSAAVQGVGANAEVSAHIIMPSP